MIKSSGDGHGYNYGDGGDHGDGGGDGWGDGYITSRNSCGSGYGHLAGHGRGSDAPSVTALIIDQDPITTAYQAVTMQTQGGISAYN